MHRLENEDGFPSREAILVGGYSGYLDGPGRYLGRREGASRSVADTVILERHKGDVRPSQWPWSPASTFPANPSVVGRSSDC